MKNFARFHNKIEVSRAILVITLQENHEIETNFRDKKTISCYSD